MNTVKADLLEALFGDLVDPDAFGKGMPDVADVHVPGPLVTVKMAKPRRAPGTTTVRKHGDSPGRRAANAVGLGATAIGTGYGVRELATKLPSAYPRTARPVEAVTSAARRLVPAKLSMALRNPKVATGLAAGLLAGDATATTVLGHNQRKSDVDKVAPKLVAGHLSRMRALAGVHTDAAARWSTYPKPPAKPGKHLRTGKPPAAEPAAAKTSEQVLNSTVLGGEKGVARTRKARATYDEAVSTTGGKAALGVGAAGLLYGHAKKKQLDYAYGKSVDFEATGTFSKLDTDKRLAFGWANVSVIDGQKVLDRQGDYIDIDDMEDAAYVFVKNTRVGGDMHRRAAVTHDFGKNEDGSPHKVADLVESMVFTPEKIAKMGLPADFPQGWWVGFHYHDDDAWTEIKEGRRTGFSVHGKGIRRPMPIEELYV